MSLMGTLAKVAVGAMVAKGVSGAMRGGGAGGGLGGLLGGALGNAGGASGGGGLGGMLGGLAGGQQGGQQGQQQGGGLAGGLGGLLSGQQQDGAQAGGAAAGGLGGLLESLGGAQGGAQAGQEQQQPQQGGFGDLFNNALAGQEPQPDPAAEKQAEVMLRAMLMAARADGEIDAAEQEKITGNLGDIDEEEANFIREEMANPTSLEAFIPTVPKGMEQQVYLMSLLAIDLDTQEEAQYLDKLAKSLNIDQATSNAIHAKLGAPALYS